MPREAGPRPSVDRQQEHQEQRRAPLGHRRQHSQPAAAPESARKLVATPDEHSGIRLPDGAAQLVAPAAGMQPAAAVSGFYFAHPQSQYCAVGKIDRDQVEDYARRRGWDLETAERWLAPNLAYEPSAQREPAEV